MKAVTTLSAGRPPFEADILSCLVRHVTIKNTVVARHDDDVIICYRLGDKKLFIQKVMF